MKLLAVLPIAAVAVLAAAAPATATTIVGLYNTGVDSTGTSLGDNAVDAHWLLDTTGATYTGAINGQFPIGPWVSNTSAVRWDSPAPDAGNYDFDHASDGIYTYTETFSLAGYKPGTASFSGMFASDNTVDSITLNGTTLAASGGSYSSLQSFNSSGATFNAGVNTLTFTVRNFANGQGSNPTGLFVELAGTADVPEPASWALLVTGFGLVGIAARRRVRAVAA